MKRLLLLALCLWAALSSIAAATEELVVGFRNTVRSNAELDAFIGDLRRAIMSAKVRDYAIFDGFFAPEIKTFHRSLDPLQPWNASGTITGSPLPQLADVFVEQEPPADGQPVPDYREDVLRTVLRMIWGKPSLGTMQQVPGSICTPAEYDFDHAAALAFARKFELDTYSLRFFGKNVFLSDKPRSKRGARVAANTLMIFDYDPKAPAGWGLYETAGGARGYMEDRDDTQGLSQSHICFAKVDGKYRITAVFGYGL